MSGARDRYALSTLLWHKTGQFGVIPEFPASLRIEVTARVEATRHREPLTSNFAACFARGLSRIGQLTDTDFGKKLCADSIQNNGP